MKRFARWLYIKTHWAELCTVSKYCKRPEPVGDDSLVGLHVRITQTGEIKGALDTLGTLDLFT